MDRQSVGETFSLLFILSRLFETSYSKDEILVEKKNYFEKGNNRTRERSNTSVLLFRKFQFIRGKISWFNVSSSTVETKDRMF